MEPETGDSRSRMWSCDDWMRFPCNGAARPLNGWELLCRAQEAERARIGVIAEPNARQPTPPDWMTPRLVRPWSHGTHCVLAPNESKEQLAQRQSNEIVYAGQRWCFEKEANRKWSDENALVSAGAVVMWNSPLMALVRCSKLQGLPSIALVRTLEMAIRLLPPRARIGITDILAIRLLPDGQGGSLRVQ
jgi:hypothetical protein